MKAIRIFTIGTVLTLAACGGGSDNAHSDTTSDDTTVQESPVSKTDTASSTPVFPPPVNIKAMMGLPFVDYTCGVQDPVYLTEHCRPDTTGFFGGYNLFNKDRNYAVLGKLISFVPGTAADWRDEHNKESFVEITLVSGDIKVWDSIGVGTTETDLLAFIGGNVHYKKGTIIYTELGEYSCSFTIDADTVSHLSISKYCKNE